MNKYYLPKNYPDNEKGARLYLKDIRVSDKEKEEKQLTIKAVKLIINYNKNEDIQPLLNASNNEAMLFSIDLWSRFTSDVGDKVHKEFKERKARIESPKISKKILSKNKGDKYKIKYFIPKDYEDSAEGMQVWFSELIRNANTDEKAKEELLLMVRAMRIIGDYHYHKDKKSLQEAIRNEPELFKTEIFTNFVADVNDGTYKPTKKYMKKETQEEHKNIVAHVKYYENMGFPVYYEDNKLLNNLSACKLTADREGWKKYKVIEVYKKRARLNGFSSFLKRTRYNDYDDRLYSFHGTAIWVLNGFRTPETIEVIDKLEKILLSLPTREELRRVEDFSRGYNARKEKLPTTQKKLRRIKKILNSRKDYDFIKSLQIKEISLKP